MSHAVTSVLAPAAVLASLSGHPGGSARQSATGKRAVANRRQPIARRVRGVPGDNLR